MKSKTLVNKDLFTLTKEEYQQGLVTDFIPDDFVAQLEWACLIIGSKMKQMRFTEWMRPTTNMHFDRAFLLNEGERLYNPKTLRLFGEYQATPDIFPLINIKMMRVAKDGVSLHKIKELDQKSKRGLIISQPYVYEHSIAEFLKTTECLYAQRGGFEVPKSFFSAPTALSFDPTAPSEGWVESPSFLKDVPSQISLKPGYVLPKEHIKEQKYQSRWLSVNLAMSYQLALMIYFEWGLYLRDGNNPGIIIPIEPIILKDLYDTSVLKFEDKKHMLHFVRDHYRRKIALPNEDYSVYVKRYLRGEYKFNYRGFYAEIIPPKYDLNRVKTRKKFINAIE